MLIDWLTPSDRALLERQLSTSTPEAIEHLLDRLPPPVDAPPEILFGYDVTPDKGVDRAKIRCAHCSRTLHWKGWVIELAPTARALIGKDCGSDHYGLDFHKVELRFRALESRKLDLLWLQNVRAHLPMLCDELRAIETHQSVLAYRDYRLALSRDFGRLSQGLARVIREHSGRLITEIRVRDLKAEETRAQRARPDLFEVLGSQAALKARASELKRWMGQQPPILKTEIIDDGVCAGWQMLTMTPQPPEIIAAMLEGAEALRDKALTQRSDSWTTPALNDGRRQLTSVFQAFDSLMRLVSASETFADPANLARIVRWSRRSDERPHGIASEGKTLIDQGPTTRLELQGYVPLLAPEIERLRRLLTTCGAIVKEATF